jgi:GNAT superfamily N-acetyltransferase
MDDVRFTTETNPSPADVERFLQFLNDYNRSAGLIYEKERLAVFARNENNEIIAGLNGYTLWNWLYIEHLAVTPAARSMGIGNKLVTDAEAEARRRGCKYAAVDTFSFQARPFYEKNGYRVCGELPDCPPGFSRYYLCKTL